ncbi:MAG TPA: ectonucleotide pyrophosphatase/phosphodiesterase [Longimicrobiales bacterium]|nr:ectonucleotide pyrophosphatase/phosphodiesterase [Longimicrobiales bacterium]
MHESARRRAVFAAALLLLGACASGQPPTQSRPADRYLVLISFDGFRSDYLDRGLTPTLDSLAGAGIRADSLIPLQPAKTFPNHYSIATGLYPGEHGIVANTFYDPARDAWYSPASRAAVEDGTWYRGEPIWVTAQRQGLRTGTMFWIGSEADVAGVRPTYWKRFDAGMPDEARVDTVLSWLRLPDAERPRLLTLYFEMTDDAGSRYGPSSPQANAAVARADSMVHRLIHGARELPFASDINYVVVSDHGMADTRDAVFLAEHVDTIGLRFATHGPFAFLYLDGDTTRMDSMRAALESVPHVAVYERDELPDEWRWNDPRMGDLVLVAEPYWQIGRARMPVPPHGAHGWPPGTPGMGAIFLASGPDVRAAGRIPAFENVHIHPFLARLLGIEPAPDISGDAAVLAPWLRE